MIDKRTPAEKGRAKREAAARVKAAGPKTFTDTEVRFGGRAEDGRLATDALYDDPKTAARMAEHLGSMGPQRTAPQPLQPKRFRMAWSSTRS